LTLEERLYTSGHAEHPNLKKHSCTFNEVLPVKKGHPENDGIFIRKLFTFLKLDNHQMTAAGTRCT
jgi:hypothetical protein